MGGILATTATLSTAMVATTIPIHADVSDTINQAKITCETKLVCKELSDFIQAQINELEQSDEPDFDRLDVLQKQLIALEKSETVFNENLIAAENNKQEQMRLSQDQKIAELRGALLENPAIRNNSKIKEFKILFIELNKLDREDEA